MMDDSREPGAPQWSLYSNRRDLICRWTKVQSCCRGLEHGSRPLLHVSSVALLFTIAQIGNAL